MSKSHGPFEQSATHAFVNESIEINEGQFAMEHQFANLPSADPEIIRCLLRLEETARYATMEVVMSHTLCAHSLQATKQLVFSDL
jgi:hypothetical protein